MWKMLILLLPLTSQAAVLDDFESAHANIFDVPDTPSDVRTWQALGNGSEFAMFRSLFVSGGAGGEASDITSAAVNAGVLTVSIPFDATLSGQVAGVSWGDSELVAVWGGEVDLSVYEAFVFEVSFITQPFVLNLSFRDAGDVQLQSQTLFVDQFGRYQVDFSEFDTIDFSRVDLLQLRINLGQAATAAGAISFSEILLLNDDEIFSNGFE